MFNWVKILFKIMGIVGDTQKEGKLWWKSKTIWGNVFTVLFMEVLPLIPGLEVTKEWFTPDVKLGLLALVNVILRIVTKEPIVW